MTSSDTSLYVFLAAILAGLAVALLLMGIASRRRARADAVIHAVASEAKPQLRDVEMARPWSERTFKPLMRGLYGFGRRLTPTRNIEHLQTNLIKAGQPGGLTVTDFLGLRLIVAAVAGPALMILLIPTVPLLSAILFGLVGFTVGLYAPNIWLSSRVRQRQAALARELPEVLDMMSICADAGLGFEAAMQKVAYHSESELARELRRTLNETRLGVRRVDALHHLVERTGVEEISAFVAVLVQADRLGISIRDVLRTQAVQMRIRRRLRAEEEGRKAPLKMLFPLVFFIFPAIFAVVLGPAIPRMAAVFSSFGGG